MVIRPMTAAYAAGGLAGPRNTTGGKSGAAVFASGRDTVSLGGTGGAGGAGLYSAGPWFKIMGSVELEVQPEEYTSRASQTSHASRAGGSLDARASL